MKGSPDDRMTGDCDFTIVRSIDFMYACRCWRHNMQGVWWPTPCLAHYDGMRHANRERLIMNIKRGWESFGTTVKSPPKVAAVPVRKGRRKR